jgi:hypothetical protein
MSDPEETPQTSAAPGDHAAAPETLSAPLATHDPGEGVAHGGAVEVPADVRRVVDALPSGSALLVTGLGTGVLQRFLLDQEKVTAGRHPRSDIFLDHATVSRSHAEFFPQADRFVVRDAGSLNGVYVNGLRVDEAVLSSGDAVQIGRYRLVFLERQAE